ncbi:MAG: CTP synthase [Calditrichaeota bacterium]|nr:CTP synthase [Calditrichota bacterium]
MKNKTKFIFTTGGVVSSLGKGIASASLGLLLKQRGYKVSMMKLDPYINVDPGTMNPFQHGEVYVTEDGAETDLDLGHYERYIHEDMTELNSVTTGKVYSHVIDKERNGDYLGATIQVIPHITDEIKSRIKLLAEKSKVDILIVEIGGTVGDIESLPFLEAIRQFVFEVGRNNALYIHLTLIPYIKAAGEIKTKPTQHSVMKLREIGLQPDFLICRTDRRLEKEIKAKIGMFCNVAVDHVIEARDAITIYEVPLLLMQEKLDVKVLESFSLPINDADLSDWTSFVDRIKKPKHQITIAMIGKYVALQDAYKSILEAFVHAGVDNDCKVEVKSIDAEDVEKNGIESFMKDVDGMLIPGGFGNRGTEGKLKSIQYAREHKIPFLGICLGLQTAVIEFARNICNLKGATSEEFDENSPFQVVHFMEEQKELLKKGGTMRLGAYPCILKKGTKAYEAYGAEKISDRHRHRYEVNNKFRKLLEDNGMIISGISPDNTLVEMIELPDHPWFVACQFHPELKSRATRVHPLFREFVKASLTYHLGK